MDVAMRSSGESTTIRPSVNRQPRSAPLESKMDTTLDHTQADGLRTISDSFQVLVEDFLKLKHIAVVGISRKSGAANAIFKKFKSSGYQVTPIHPTLESFEGEPCYQQVADLPTAPDGVFIMTRPDHTLEITRNCIEANVSFIWMHNMNGIHPQWAKNMASKAGSVHPDAVQLAEDAGIRVIAGSCPMQYLKPVDPFHRCIRWINEKTGSV